MRRNAGVEEEESDPGLEAETRRVKVRKNVMNSSILHVVSRSKALFNSRSIFLKQIKHKSGRIRLAFLQLYDLEFAF